VAALDDYDPSTWTFTAAGTPANDAVFAQFSGVRRYMRLQQIDLIIARSGARPSNGQNVAHVES
jgi:hypothetical protein